MVLSKRVGLLPGPGLALSFWFPFFLELWLLYFLLSWSFFGRYLGCNSVPGQGLDSCMVVWLSFFVAVLVGPFVAVLVCWSLAIRMGLLAVNGLLCVLQGLPSSTCRTLDFLA